MDKFIEVVHAYLAHEHVLIFRSNGSTPIIAPCAGVLEAVDFDKNFGNVVSVRYNDGTLVKYGGLACRLYLLGCTIEKGQVIGTCLGRMTIREYVDGVSVFSKKYRLAEEVV